MDAFVWKTDPARLNLHQFFSGSAERKEDELISWRQQYKSYKEGYVKHLLFDPLKPNLSKQSMLLPTKISPLFSDVTLDHGPLEEVYIFFDTATYDQIERDVKVEKATFANITSCTK